MIEKVLGYTNNKLKYQTLKYFPYQVKRMWKQIVDTYHYYR